MTGTAAVRGRTIAILIRNLDSRGPEKMRLALARAFLDKGYRVELLIMHRKGTLADMVPDGSEVHGLKRSRQLHWRLKALAGGSIGFKFVALTMGRRVRDNALAYLPALVDYLKQRQPDALLSANPYINLTALLARRIARTETPILVSEHNALDHGDALGRGFELRRLVTLMRIYDEAEMIVGVSEGVSRELTKRGGFPKDRVTTIYNPAVGPEMPGLAAEPLDHPWFAPGAPPVILSVARLSETKGHPTLIRAFERVRKQRDVRLVVLGQAGNADKTRKRQRELMDLANSLGVGDAVAMMGFELNPYRYMARSSVLVVASLYEGFSNVIPEALACGCPVVSTDCHSGPAEILDDGRYGPLVPVGDDEAMANAILATLDSPLPAEMLRQRGREFSVDRAAALYERVLDKRTSTTQLA